MLPTNTNMRSKVRQASHAGSWYSDDKSELDAQLSSWLGAVSNLPRPLDVCAEDVGSNEIALPVPNCKAVIAPHAGYSYSGPAAAYAYRCIDPSVVKRVFVLGPSHHSYLDGCAVSKCDAYATPLGSLPIDKALTAELHASGQFSQMEIDVDEDEHSLEMHLPYIRKIFEHQDVQIVPILVGAISTAKEQRYGALLAKYLADPETVFVVSSDFCHWGSRFGYTYYRASTTVEPVSLSARASSASYAALPIHQSIRNLDEQGILAITYPDGAQSAKTAVVARDQFAAYIKKTKNTVCGRHPIGVLLAALAHLEETQDVKSECKFTRYEQSSPCTTPRDSSVSYASAYVQFQA